MRKALNLIKILIIPTLLIFFTTFSNQILALSSEWVINDKSKVRLISAKKSIDNIQKMTDGNIEKIDQILELKKNDILKV